MLLAYLAPHIFVAVDSGEGGVLWRRFFGGTELDWSYGEGTAVVWPWDRVYVYDVSVQQIRVEAPVYTSDGLLVQVSVSSRFRVDRSRLPELHIELGPDYVAKLVEPELITAVRMVIGRYDSKQVYTRGERRLRDEIREEFRNRLEGQLIDFHDVLLVKLKIPERMQEAIVGKLASEQERMAHEFIKQRRIVEAEGLRAFEDISNISAIHWHALETTAALAASNNAKMIVVGNDASSLPVLLNAEFEQTVDTAESPSPGANMSFLEPLTSKSGTDPLP